MAVPCINEESIYVGRYEGENSQRYLEGFTLNWPGEEQEIGRGREERGRGEKTDSMTTKRLREHISQNGCVK